MKNCIKNSRFRDGWWAFLLRRALCRYTYSCSINRSSAVRDPSSLSSLGNKNGTAMVHLPCSFFLFFFFLFSIAGRRALRVMRCFELRFLLRSATTHCNESKKWFVVELTLFTLLSHLNRSFRVFERYLSIYLYSFSHRVARILERVLDAVHMAVFSSPAHARFQRSS